mgnify:CR=1 FL=1
MAKESLEILTESIYDNVKQKKDAPSKKDIKLMLLKIQAIVNDEKLTEEEKDKKLTVISQALYKGGAYTI